MAKKVQHGGKRKGAGRPPKESGKAVTIAVTVPDDLAAGLDRFAEARGWTRSRAVTEALRAMLAHKKTRRE